ncbi:MAG: AIR carboxylase family protein [Nanoarchaeota archaeon]|nr:AIR carboxylase family protein [Nanoarchaeota archaeon]
MKFLCVFGSKSDEPFYDEICSRLKTPPEICSAHRDPERLKDLVTSTDAEFIIAGAGLAAHLPGVIASMTRKPVIGMPIAANLDGLDSLLSIMQMPPGIPVLCSGVNATGSILRFLDNLDFQGIDLISDGKCEDAMDKAREMMERFNYPEGNFPVVFHDSIRSKGREDGINVFCGKLKAEDAPMLLEITKNGLWVGLNRGDNAVLAAIQILERNNPFPELIEYREKLK